MIFAAINTIKTELNNYISCELGNISEILSADTSSSGTNAEIIISLINIEENRISRDPQNFIKKSTGIILKNPAIHLNLSLLFTSIKKGSGYESSITNVQKVIEFFQIKSVFDHINTPALDPGIEKLILDMVSMNLEQLNQLWSIIGNKYCPSVIYKMRMVTIDSVTDQQAPIIKEVEARHELIN